MYWRGEVESAESVESRGCNELFSDGRVEVLKKGVEGGGGVK